MKHDRRAVALMLASLAIGAASPRAASAQTGATPAELKAHSAEFRQELIRITDGVYLAVGYAASNVILLQGPDGVVIIDTAPNPVEAAAIKSAFSHIANGPVKAIIYTHAHPDHTGGARVFAGSDKPQIIAGFAAVEPPIGRPGQDGADQFGMNVPDALYINAGTQLEFGRKVKPTSEGYLAPTHIVSGPGEALTVAGLDLTIIVTPGEASEAISVWFPAKRVLISGDNILKTFPNIAPIRGATIRPPDQWIASLDTMLALKPDFLLPGHMRPVIGAATVAETITAYRDAIKLINDQTLAAMKRGERPDTIVAEVKLPPALATHPYLREYYGSVEWMVRGIYAARLGWFDGNATNVFPSSLAERATNLLPMIGGEAGAIKAAEKALAEGKYLWAAELADLVLAERPGHPAARSVKIRALTELGKREGNAIARNWYLSVATHLGGKSVKPD